MADVQQPPPPAVPQPSPFASVPSPSVNLSSIPSESLTPEQRFQLEHAGHEQQHATMALILISSLLFSQIAISLWKKYHPRSYNLTTLLGLWLVPPVLGYRAGNYRYVTVWVLFSIANSFVVKKAMENPMKSGTPGVVYRWYTWVYNISYAVGIVGYVIMIVTFFHVPILAGMARETEENIFTGAITLLFYGLYFGTLGRDFVDRLSDRMATTMGYYSRTGFPAKHLRSNQCAICGEVTDTSGGAESRQIGIGTGTTPKGTVVKVHRLTCGHAFHEQCIRGWTIIGKKDVCPCCKEKVDLKAFKTNPWDTTQQMYLNLLDALRYMVVWNPIVFLIIHVIFEVFGFK